MDRARTAAVAALFAFLAVSTGAAAAVAPMLQSIGLPDAAVGWPPSTLVVSEVQTGGASASDEFAEIANVGPADVDLAGLEVVYVTSTGGTVTRKATWASATILSPGRHLLVANSLGSFASIADAVYSGGLAATGGAVVLRVVGGAPIDAVGWGDASSSFVEGTPAPAPPAGQSIERRPGGTAGNTTDTNDNGADWFAQATPDPQDLAAPPVPVPGASASPTIVPAPSPVATPVPTPSASEAPTASPVESPLPSETAAATPSAAPTSIATPSPEPTVAPSVSPAPTSSASPGATAGPTASPTVSPSPTPTDPPAPSPSPSPSVTATPTPTPTPTPSPAPSSSPSPSPVATVVAIAEARTSPLGAVVTIEGVLTTVLPALESARVGYVQDATAGIAVYLESSLSTPLAAGTTVRLTGTIDERYAARTIRVAAADIVDLGSAVLPAPAAARTGAVGEDLEGLRVTVSGVTSGSPTAFADGLGLLVDDGSGQVRVVVGPDALAAVTVPGGTSVTVTGPVGQRDSTGSGTTGYRIIATLPGELDVVTPLPSPSPTPSPSPAPTASPSPTAGASPTPAPTAAPTPAPTVTPRPTPSPPPAISIADARSRPVGTVVTVLGVVTAEAGRLGTPPLVAIADATAGIAVRLPDGTAAPARGLLLRVTGATSAPYGQLEVRPSSSGIAVVGSDALPEPIGITGSQLGEGTEGRLVVLAGTQVGAPSRSPTGDISIDVVDAAGAKVRVLADSTSGIVAADLQAGAAHGFTGIAGQRATRKGATDGYRISLRDRADIGPAPGTAGSGDGSGASATSGPGTATIPSAGEITIAAARLLNEQPATVAGIVIGGPGLLDADGRRIVIEDASGGIEVLLPADAVAPAVGQRIRATGIVGRAWDAPRLRATVIEVLDQHVDVAPIVLTSVPGVGQEWRLVRIAGTVTHVTRLGDQWRADVRSGSANVLVTGVAGSHIPSTLLHEGQAVTVSGIVRRPYPTATDRRWAVTPRGTYDLAVGRADVTGSTAGQGASRAVAGGSNPGSATAYGSDGVTGVAADVDLATLSDSVGELVRVGGLVAALTADGFTLDDGTAVEPVRLSGDAEAFHALLRVGDALGLVGRVELVGGVLRIVVADPAGLVRLGALGEVVPIAATATATRDVTTTPTRRSTTAGLAGPLDGPVIGWPGFAGAALVSAASIGLTIARRRQAHRRLLVAVMARLGALRAARRPSDDGR